MQDCSCDDNYRKAFMGQPPRFKAKVSFEPCHKGRGEDGPHSDDAPDRKWGGRGEEEGIDDVRRAGDP